MLPQRLFFPREQLHPVAQVHGVLVLDKPKGPSSAGCLAVLKRLGQKKIGHAGTLDPLASGVLLVLLGHATKISGHLMADGGKIYRGTLKLGESTDSWDTEGEVVARKPWEHISEAVVKEGICAWTALTEQAVPPISAAKHQGQSLYRLARAGRAVPEKVKAVKIFQAAPLSVALPQVSFRVACSSGTYIRSLAHSLGMRLGCGAVLTELIREYSHPFGLEEAHTLEEIVARPERLAEWVLPVTRALPHWKTVTLTPAEEIQLRNGVPVSPRRRENGTEDLEPVPGSKAVAQAASGRVLALLQAARVSEGDVRWTVLRGLWD